MLKEAGKAFDIYLLIPSAMAGILVLNMSSAIASGGFSAIQLGFAAMLGLNVHLLIG